MKPFEGTGEHFSEQGKDIVEAAKEIGKYLLERKPPIIISDNPKSRIPEIEIKRIHTINEALEGKCYPGTSIEYRKHIVNLDGELVEGVFPKFPSKCDVKLPRSMRMASDSEQFKYCTQKLAERIERDPDFAKQFSSRQISQIKAGEPRISGLTWHHNEIPGKMQLVDSALHDKCRHTGGRSLWGGGSDNR